MSKVRLIEALAWKRGEMSWPMNLQTLGASRTCSLLCSNKVMSVVVFEPGYQCQDAKGAGNLHEIALYP